LDCILAGVFSTSPSIHNWSFSWTFLCGKKEMVAGC